MEGACSRLLIAFQSNNGFLTDSSVIYFIRWFVDKPEAPKNFTVTTTHKNSIDVTWTAPASDGGAPILEYIIEKQDTKRGTWSAADKAKPGATQHTIGKLVEGNEYMFRISAENEVGVSSAAEIKAPVIAKSPHGQWRYIIIYSPIPFYLRSNISGGALSWAIHNMQSLTKRQLCE